MCARNIKNELKYRIKRQEITSCKLNNPRSINFGSNGTKLTSLNPKNLAPDGCLSPVSYTSKTFFKRMPYIPFLYNPGSEMENQVKLGQLTRDC